ncbi:MAG: conjugal transfer protein TraB [Rhizobium sp.]
MRLSSLAPAVLAAVSVASGWIGWSGVPELLPVTLLFPLVWSLAATRAAAMLVSASYFLAATRSLPQAVAIFYATDIWPGLALWLVASLTFVSVHTVLWTGKGELVHATRYLIASLLMALPPFGIVGWAHPITAAGALFPGYGWFGLGATAAGQMMLTTRWRPAAVVALGFSWVWSASTWTPLTVPEGWHAMDLELGSSLGRNSSLLRQRDLLSTIRTKTAGTAQIVVLPESALGFWTPTVERFWQDGLQGSRVTVIAGAVEVDSFGYDNIMVAMAENRPSIVYRQRVPVPGAMWQPWRVWLGESGGATASFFRNPYVDLPSHRVAALICYEQLIVWPILQSMYRSPDIVVAIGNGWWTGGTPIISIQLASARSWARLFNKPLISAFNR